MILSGNTNGTATRSTRLSTKVSSSVVQDENKLSTKVADKKAGVVKQRSVLGDISNKLAITKAVKAEKPVCNCLTC
jgi:hypothetical protein